MALGFARWAIARQVRLSGSAALSGQRAMRATVLRETMSAARDLRDETGDEDLTRVPGEAAGGRSSLTLSTERRRSVRGFCIADGSST